MEYLEPKQKDQSKFIRALFKVAYFQKQHWVISLFFVNLSAIWLPILYTFLGVQCHLVRVVNGSCQFTDLGLIVMIAAMLIIFGGNVATLYYERENDELQAIKLELEEQMESSAVLYDLKSSTNTVCDNKLATLIDFVNQYILDQSIQPPKVISNPEKQLDSLAKELSGCIARLLKFRDQRYITDIFTSIIYRFPNEDSSWHWATTERGMSIGELLTPIDSKKSSLLYLIESKGHILFKNSKQKAYEKGCYLPDNEDEYDEDGCIKGSIACFQYSIKKNDKAILDFIITITSYTRQFAPDHSDGDEFCVNIKNNLAKVIMPDFIVRTKIELCLLYLSHLNKKRSQQAEFLPITK